MIQAHDGDHGVQWADFDLDGALDLALANNEAMGSHYLFRNQLPVDQARRSLQVLVLDDKGHFTKAGSEVRLYAAGTCKLLGTNIVDTGSGYCSQNAMPAHFGLGSHDGAVDVEVTHFTPAGRVALECGCRASGYWGSISSSRSAEFGDTWAAVGIKSRIKN